MIRSSRYGPSIIVLATAIVVLLAGPVLVKKLGHAHSLSLVQNARRELQSSTVLEQVNSAIRDIAQAVEPSVVHINVTIHPDPKNPNITKLSTGSGWVYDNAGHIITNEHVIADASIIEVRFHDGTPERAVLVGADKETDIAVLQVESDLLIPALMATDSRIFQGDMVFAFGSPFGFEFSMSSGIVSGQKRQTSPSYFLADHYENYIQIDAAINPGNSGGPLTNVRGEVIGMNVSIAVDNNRMVETGGQYVNAGVGFAIPLDMIKFVADQLIESGQVERGGLGLVFTELDESVRNRLGYHKAGIWVQDVYAGSPAFNAGLRVDDVIFEINNEPVIHGESFRDIVHGLLPGTQIVLNIWRANKEIQLAVVLGIWNKDKLGKNSVQSLDTDDRPVVFYDDNLGFTLVEVTQKFSKRLGLDVDHGLYIQSVRIGSLAWDFGFKAGGVIIIIDGKAIHTIDRFLEILKSENAHKGISVTIIQGTDFRSELNFKLADDG